MAPDFKTILAATVLNDEHIVSYRSLSRELKVHSNVAKKMLYEFHHGQNLKKPGSVHATYLLDGAWYPVVESQMNGAQQDGEDVHMQSSPYMSSSMPQESNEEDALSSRGILLARQENLEAAKARFEQIYSIHVYSLGPSSVQNLQILSECNRAVSAKHIGEDPLVVGTQYGVIHNSRVKRRTGKKSVAPTPSSSVVKSKEKTVAKTQEAQKSTKRSPTTSQPPPGGQTSTPNPKTETPKVETKAPDRKPTSKPVPLKREKSNIFKSFAKPKAKLNKEDTNSSVEGSNAPTTVDPIIKSDAVDGTKNDSEDEEEDTFVGNNKVGTQLVESRLEREEQIRKMMDDEDEEMKDVIAQPPQASQDASSAGTPISEQAPSPEAVGVTTGGRRRGRRKVMKKKTMKDEEGYLVTKEEPSWESFSEDEPAPLKDKSRTTTTFPKAKKPGSQPGQGNIMSFFGKK